MDTTLKAAKYAVLISAIASLAGCAKKPPSCGDAETLELARSLIIKEARNSPGVAQLMNDLPTLDPDGSIIKYMQSAIDISMITSGGYDTAAKRYSCNAKLGRKDIPGSEQVDITYTTQRTEPPMASGFCRWQITRSLRLRSQ